MLKIIIKNARIIRTGVVFDFENIRYFVKQQYLENHVKIDLNILEGAEIHVMEDDTRTTKTYTYINQVEKLFLKDSEKGTQETTEVKISQIQDNLYKKINDSSYEHITEAFSVFDSKGSIKDSGLNKFFKAETQNFDINSNILKPEISVLQNFINCGNPKGITGLEGVSNLLITTILEMIKLGIEDEIYISVDPSFNIDIKNSTTEMLEIVKLFGSIFKTDIVKEISSVVENIIFKTTVTNKMVFGTEEEMFVSLVETDKEGLLPSFVSSEQVEYGKITKEALNKIAAHTFHSQNITALKNEQFIAIKKLLVDEENILAVLKTGFGKSLIYQMYAFLQPVMIVAVFPINALISDQAISLKNNGFDFCFDNEEIKRHSNLTSSSVFAHKRLFLITAERLENYEVNKSIKSLSSHIGAVVFDEAHCISEWGHDFRPSYLVARYILSNIKQENSKLKVIALTATAAPYIQDDIKKILNIPNHGVINLADIGGLERKELQYKLIKMEDEGRIRRGEQGKFWNEISINEALKRVGKEGTSIFYFIYSRKGAMRSFYDSNIPNSGLYTGGPKMIYDHDGNIIYEKQFEKFKEVDVVFATKAFGMGINLQECNYVGILQPPSSLEDLYQQAGRAGRKGQDSLVNIFYSDIHLRSPLDTLSPFSFFLSNDEIRMRMQPILLMEILDIIHENNYESLTINIDELYKKHKSKLIKKTRNNFDNYAKWAIAHLISEFEIIDYYTTEYARTNFVFSVKRIRIFINDKITSSTDVKDKIMDALKKRLIETSSTDEKLNSIETFYEYYFSKIENEKKIGINIFIDELKKIDGSDEVDSNQLINKSINDYYETRSDSLHKFNKRYYELMKREQDFSYLKSQILSISQSENMTQLLEMMSRFEINEEYIFVTSVIMWHLFDLKPTIGKIEDLLSYTYKSEYIKSILQEIMEEIFAGSDRSKIEFVIESRKEQEEFSNLYKLLIKTKEMRKWND